MTLMDYLKMPMVYYALIVGVLIALCSSLLGVTLVLKRLSFIGTGLSNVAFGTMAVAAAASLTNNFLLVLPVTIVSAILLMRSGQRAKVNGDAALAMISAGSLAVGYLLMSKFPSSANASGDVCEVLFGGTRILTLPSRPEVIWICIVLSILVFAVFILFYNKIFAVTFDDNFSAATGVKASTYNLILAVVIAVIIVLAVELVGALLITALVVFPATSAMRVFKSFKSVVICSVIFSVACTTLGILISIVAGTPIGSTIVATDIAGFIIFSAAGFIVRRA